MGRRQASSGMWETPGYSPFCTPGNGHPSPYQTMWGFYLATTALQKVSYILKSMFLFQVGQSTKAYNAQA